jgi:formylglycine-generating enzyme required for sulfatase activity
MKHFLILIILIINLPVYASTYHPADTNKDWQISQAEFQAYNTAWKHSQNWPEPPNPIPGLYAARAGYLYKKGNCYHVGNADAPMKWMSDMDCDGSVDIEDKCPEDPNKIEPGLCGCGTPETMCPFTNSLGMSFVKIEPGTFMMGSPSDESGRDSDETQHQVTLTKGYLIQTTEVTQGQWKEIMGSNPSYFSSCGDNCPVEKVSWNDIQEFIQKLNQKESGRNYRLPTEAEWEYAARAGSTKPFAFGDCLSTNDANYDGNYPLSGCSKGSYRNKTIEVGQLRANDWGLYDMHGNVWEWCNDWYGEYNSSALIDPVGPTTGASRVVRGGGWSSNARYCRSAFRDWFASDIRFRDLGFRLVASLASG